MMASIVLLEFLILALLGSALVTVIQWETWFGQNRESLQQNLRKTSNRLRQLRIQVENTRDGLPGLELSPANRRKWMVLRWTAKALLSARYARP